MIRRAALAVAALAAAAAPARAEDTGGAAPSAPPPSELSDEELVRLAEESGELIVVWDERPEKPFDRDTRRRLTAEEIAARGATDLATALALLPDVTVRDAGRGGFILDIRGARKGAVRVLVDGVAVSDPFYGTFDVSTIPVTDIAEIRVSTAPASPIDGPGGPGGVVEVHTRDAIGPSLVVARLTSTSLPTFGASATGRVPLAETVALRLSATSTFGAQDYRTASGATVDDRRRATTGAFRIEHRRGGRRVVADGYADDRRYVSPPSDELATALILLIDRETTGRVGLGLDDELGPDRKLQLQVRGWAHAMTRLSRNFRDPALTDQVSAEDLSSMRAGARGLVTGPLGRRARWVTSLTIDHERADAVTDTGASQILARGHATVIEGAGGGQLELGGFKASGAGGIAVPAGIDAAPWPEAKLAASYARRFGEVELIAARKGRVPSLRERFQGAGANVALDPEQAWHGELRVTARPRRGVELVAAPYVRHMTGMVKVGVDNLLMNLGELTVRGIETSARAAVTREVTVGGAYLHARASSDDLGPDPLDHFPAHRGDGWIEIRPVERVRAMVRARWTGEVIDRGETSPAHLLWEVTANARLGDGWLAVLRCDDLFDVRPETRSGYRLPGRVVSLVVQHTWE